MSILLSMFALVLMVSLLWVILAGLFWSMRLTEKNFQFALNASLAICRRLDAVLPFRSTTNHHFDCTKMTHPQQTTREVIEQLVEALDDAATSLETISRLAGKTHYVSNDGERLETYMEHHDQVRGYAISRASVVRAALSRAQAAPAVGVPDDYDLGVLRELSATLRDRSPERHAALERLLAASAQPQQKEGV